MDALILKAEDISLSNVDLHRMTTDDIKILTYDQLSSYDTIDRVLAPHGAVIILYQTSENYGHWVLLFKKNSGSELEFFDSYGLNVDEELDIINEDNLRVHHGIVQPHLTQMLNASNYKVSHNSVKLQKHLSHVNTCGRYVIFRYNNRFMELDEFNKILTKNKHYDADFWVSSLTYFL